MFNVAGRFDRRRFWIYASFAMFVRTAPVDGIARTSNYRRSGRAGSFDLGQGGVNQDKVP
jgi:hypothetical protein